MRIACRATAHALELRRFRIESKHLVGWGSRVRAGVMAAHDASHVYVAVSVAGTTRIRCIDFGFVTCSVLHISGDCVSVHGPLH